MQLNNIYLSQFNGIDTDFRAEIIAAEMIENNTPADRILIVPLGAMNRPQRKDVDSVMQETSEYDNKEYVLINTHKEGLYDKLPEGLFHGAISHVYNQADNQVVEAIRLHRKEEKEARRFFLPLDAALNSLRVQIALYENQLDKKFHYNELVNIFAGHWEIFKYLDVRQANVFLQVLPVLHSIRDKWSVIEGIFEQLFETKVSISSRTGAGKKPATGGSGFAGISSALGQSVLGVDMITGNVSGEPGSIEIVITFGPITTGQLQLFTGSGNQQHVVEKFCDYFFPADADIAIDYDLQPEERGFRLSGSGEQSANCSMGLSTYL